MTTHETRTDFGRSTNENRDGLLRLVLKLDAVASGALSALSVAASPVMDDLLSTPLVLLVPVGAFLVIWAAALWVLASRPQISRTAVWSVIGLNLLYAAGAIVVAMAGWFPLSALGTAFVLTQAAAVALVAAAQFYALRRAA